MLAAGGGSSGEGGRKRRQEACALGFLSESLIVVCQQGQGSFSWLAPSPFYSSSVSAGPSSSRHQQLRVICIASCKAARSRGLRGESQRGRERRADCRQRDEFFPAYQTSQFTQSGMVMGVKGGPWGGPRFINSVSSAVIELGLAMQV